MGPREHLRVEDGSSFPYSLTLSLCLLSKAISNFISFAKNKRLFFWGALLKSRKHKFTDDSYSPRLRVVSDWRTVPDVNSV